MSHWFKHQVEIHVTSITYIILYKRSLKEHSHFGKMFQWALMESWSMEKYHLACASRLQQNFTYALLLFLLCFSSQLLFVLFPVIFMQAFKCLWKLVFQKVKCIINFRIGFRSEICSVAVSSFLMNCRVAHYFRHFENFCPGKFIDWKWQIGIKQNLWSHYDGALINNI